MDSTRPSSNEQKRSRRLLDLTDVERVDFLASFDTVLCDCDGVVWKVMQEPIKDVEGGIEFLKKAGKHIAYVTNNSIRSAEEYVRKFEKTNIEVDSDDIIHPVRSIIKYLEKINFEGLIYCIATNNFKEALRNAGYIVIDGPNEILKENLIDFAKNVFHEAPVRAVIIDIDYNLSAPKLIRAHLYLKHPECILIGGAAGMLIPFGKSDIIGPGPYIKMVELSSGKKPIILGKPGKELGEMVKQQFSIENPKRILFIGDMLETDVGFGNMCGFQTLVVLTGATKLDDLHRNQNEVEIPDYYTDSLADFMSFLKYDK